MIFSFQKTPARRVKARMTRDTLAEGKPVAKGDVIEIDETLVGELGAEVLALIDADGNEQPLPPPASADLPQLNQPAPIPADTPDELRALAKAEAALEAAQDWHRRTLALIAAPKGGVRAHSGANIAQHGRINEAVLEIEADIRKAREVAGVEQLKAGRAVAEVMAGVNVACEAVAALGFEIFAARLAPLGLHPNKVHDLFRGSALFEKYVTPMRTVTSGSERFGFDERGRSFTYCDAWCDTLTAWLRSAREREAKAGELLKEARAELARVQKATKEAA